MQGDRNVIDLLNDVLTAELTSVNQYFADAKMCANWGYELLRQIGEQHYLAQQIRG